MSVFKNYEPGEPTCRLYVKNIAKQVEEKVGGFVKLNAYHPFICLVYIIFDFYNRLLFIH